MKESLLDKQENEDEVHPLPTVNSNVLQVSDESGMKRNSLRSNTVVRTSNDSFSHNNTQYLTGTFDPKEKNTLYAFGNENQRGGN